MAKKPGLTIDQHNELGAELLSIREQLMKIKTVISEAYPFKLSDPLQKALSIIVHLRAELDSKVAEENKDMETVHIYYRNLKHD